MATYSEIADWAWAAGFYDGEGHCSARDNSSGGRQIKIQITQNDREVLEKLIRIFGGRIVPRRSSNSWSYQISKRNEVMLFCWKIWPWLGEIKRDQFDSAFKDYKALERRRLS